VSRPVRLKAIGPILLSHDAPGFLDVIEQPRQRQAQGIAVIESVDGEIARLAQRTIEAFRHPWMRAMHVLAHRNGMHDRKNACAAPIVLLHFFVVGKRPLDARISFEKKLRYVDQKERVKLFCLEQPLQGLPASEEVESYALWQIERNKRRLE